MQLALTNHVIMEVQTQAPLSGKPLLYCSAHWAKQITSEFRLEQMSPDWPHTAVSISILKLGLTASLTKSN